MPSRVVSVDPKGSDFKVSLKAAIIAAERSGEDIPARSKAILESFISDGASDTKNSRLTVDKLRVIRECLPQFPIAASLHGGKIIVPGIQEKKINPEHIKERERLKRRLDEMEYNEMVKGIDTRRSIQATKEPTEEKAGMQAALGLNVGITAVAVFFGLYILSKRYLGDDTKAAMIGLSGAILVMIVETLLIIIHSTRRDKHQTVREKQTKRKPTPQPTSGDGKAGKSASS